MNVPIRRCLILSVITNKFVFENIIFCQELTLKIIALYKFDNLSGQPSGFQLFH